MNNPKKERRVLMATILLTGATGAVGSSLAPLLRAQGHQLIYLIRPKFGQQPIDRLAEILGCVREDDIVWDGDVTLPYAGVSDVEKRNWKGRIEKIVNCAASIKFDRAFAEITTGVNVGGVKNLLDLAEALGIPEFHQISTAYVAGDANYFTEEDFDIGQTPRNVYEETKKEAERLVRNWEYGRWSIYRLGIVVGDYLTGYISSFNGYYGFESALWHLKQSLITKDKFEREEYEKEGIRFDSNEMLILPIYFNFSPNSTLNFVPLDWVREVVSDLIAFPAANQVFHIVHPRPKKARWLNDVSSELLGIKGFSYGDSADYSFRPLSGRLQKIFDRGTVQYLPYITHECKFAATNVFYTLNGKYTLPPEIDEHFIARLLNYAKLVDFGRKKLQPKAVEA